MIAHYSRLWTMATILIVLAMPRQCTSESEQQSTADKLVNAIWGNDSNTVHDLLAKGIELNSRDTNGTTPLIEATNARPELAKELVTNGANPNFPSGTGSTPLMHAASHCQLDLARFLLDHGARLDAKDRDGQTGLMYAAWGCQNGRMVQLLLEAGAAVNDRSKDGGTALMRAASSGDLEAVKALVAAGADLNATDDNGETAFTLAQAHRYMLNKKAHKRISSYLRRVSEEAARQQSSHP
jgi:ankyrin repeat protein